jgi:hypothetical protein
MGTKSLSPPPPSSPNARPHAGPQRRQRFGPRLRRIELGGDRSQGADTRGERVTIALDDLVKLSDERGLFRVGQVKVHGLDLGSGLPVAKAEAGYRSAGRDDRLARNLWQARVAPSRAPIAGQVSVRPKFMTDLVGSGAKCGLLGALSSVAPR